MRQSWLMNSKWHLLWRPLAPKAIRDGGLIAAMRGLVGLR
jgi:hypothetical protein